MHNEKGQNQTTFYFIITNFRSDIVIDIVCEAIDFLGGKAHQGMADATMEILEEIKDTLRTALKKYPGFKLFITGHSLGGGVGTLMTMAIRAGKIQDYVPSDVPLMCKVFAPPPVFFSEVSSLLKNTSNRCIA